MFSPFQPREQNDDHREPSERVGRGASAAQGHRTHPRSSEGLRVRRWERETSHRQIRHRRWGFPLHFYHFQVLLISSTYILNYICTMTNLQSFVPLKSSIVETDSLCLLKSFPYFHSKLTRNIKIQIDDDIVSMMCKTLDDTKAFEDSLSNLDSSVCVKQVCWVLNPMLKSLVSYIYDINSHYINTTVNTFF